MSKLSNNINCTEYESVTRPRPSINSDEANPDNKFLPSRRGRLELEVHKIIARRYTAAPEQISPNLIAGMEPEHHAPPKLIKPGSLKRGHLASFVGLLVFTFLLYFRPYELFPSLGWLYTSAFWSAAITLTIFIPMQLALEGNLTARPKEVNLILLLVLAALFSIPLAFNPALAWAEFSQTYIKAVLMFIVMVNVVRTERRMRMLMWLGLAVGCFLSVNAIGDFRAGRLLVTGTRVAGALGGMFGNPNDMALHLVTMVPIAVAFAFTKRNLVSKIAYAICAALLVAGIVVSFSRGGFLGLLAVAAVLSWKLGARHKWATGIILFIAAMAFIVLAPGGYGNRLSSIMSISSDLTGSSGARWDLLMRSLLVSARHPLLGIGIGNFPIVAFQASVSHNAYTQVSAEMGLTALVLYVWFLIAPLKRLRAIQQETFLSRRASRYYYFSVGLQAALIGYMVSSFFASVAYQFYVYYLVGYAVCLRQLYEAARAEGSEVVNIPQPAEVETNRHSVAPDHPALAKPCV